LGAVRQLLHPYLHWVDGNGKSFRGRRKVLAMLDTLLKPRQKHARSSCGTDGYTAGLPDRRPADPWQIRTFSSPGSHA
jgi:hypothetical protein